MNRTTSKPCLFLLATALFAQGVPASGQVLKYNLVLSKYDYQEGFEVNDPFVIWASNGPYEVHYKGFSTKRASEGDQSLKIDVTLSPGTYVYWKVPLNLPSDANQVLRFKADLFVESIDDGTVEVGTSIRLSPPNFSGTNKYSVLRAPTADWVRVDRDLIPSVLQKVNGRITNQYGGSRVEDYGVYTENLGLFLFSKQGGRFVIYVDGLSVTGNAPDAAQYDQAVRNSWESYLARVNAEVTSMKDEIHAVPQEPLDAAATDLITDAKAEADEIAARTASQGYPSPADFTRLEELHRLAVSYLAPPTGSPIDVYSWDPLGPKKLLPSTHPVPAPRTNQLSVTAAPGEVEPASFVIRANQAISNLAITVSDLVSPTGDVIPAAAVDPYLVLPWYQAGKDNLLMTQQKHLVPEILAKDHDLLKVDETAQKNLLRIYQTGVPSYIDVADPGTKVPAAAEIRDADQLVPFSISEGKNQQVWLVIRVPSDAKAGDYAAKINLASAASGVSEDVAVSLRVHPFTLEPSVLENGIYYRGVLSGTPGGFNSDNRDAQQYAREVANMFDHGITHPTLNQSVTDATRLREALTIRETAGMPSDRLYVMRTSPARVLSGMSLADFVQEVQQWPIATDGFGFEEYYFYGKDEKNGEEMLAQSDAWEAIHN
ncbi:MAG: hypothetical protein WBG92_08605, partial [Thiohalocapsa sp.]